MSREVVAFAILPRMAETPTIYEWAGGTEAFGRWLNVFYDLVEDDELLARSSAGRSAASTATTCCFGGSR
jgi:truncated hemoglobin YjbI